MMIRAGVCRTAACQVGSDRHLRFGLCSSHFRNEVEAASKEAIRSEGLFQVSIQSSITEIPAGAFKGCNQVVTVAIPESVTLPLRIASFTSMTTPKSVTCSGQFVRDLGIVRCLCTLRVYGEHDYPQVCDVYLRFDVRHRLGDCQGSLHIANPWRA